MANFSTLIQQKFSSQFIRNLGWLSASEAVIRVFRLVTTVILARFLTDYDYGLAAIVLTTNEFVQVATRFGIGAKLIQIEEEKLDRCANSAYWLNWLIYLGLFAVQCVVAVAIAQFYNDQRLILPICLTASIYLIVPISYIQSILIQRENRLKILAITNALQVSVDNVLTAIFAFLGFGLWAIVLPKILVAPIWVIINYYNHPWRPKRQFTTEYWGELVRFGQSVLGMELLKTLRYNLDYLLVGRLIGIKELGIYYFAFNAGLGISLSVINAISAALYPHLCSVRSNYDQFQAQYLASLKTAATIIIPLVLLQSSLAPVYVPIVFGQKWVEAVPILILICLSAIPRPFADAASSVWLAFDQPNVNLLFGVGFTVFFGLSLVVGSHWGIVGVAIAVLLTYFISQPLFSVWTTREVLRRATTS